MVQPTFRYFFDQPRVRRLVDKKTLAALRRIGLTTRKIARQSMKSGGNFRAVAAANAKIREENKTRPKSRRRKLKTVKTSAPGQPPRFHNRKLKDNIFTSLDPRRRTMVAGPVQRGGKGRKATKPISQRTGAALLEVGGKAKRKLSNGRTVQFNVKQRPYMEPAFEKAKKLPNLKKAWRSI